MPNISPTSVCFNLHNWVHVLHHCELRMTTRLVATVGTLGPSEPGLLCLCIQRQQAASALEGTGSQVLLHVDKSFVVLLTLATLASTNA